MNTKTNNKSKVGVVMMSVDICSFPFRAHRGAANVCAVLGRRQRLGHLRHLRVWNRVCGPAAPDAGQVQDRIGNRVGQNICGVNLFQTWSAPLFKSTALS